MNAIHRVTNTKKGMLGLALLAVILQAARAGAPSPLEEQLRLLKEGSVAERVAAARRLAQMNPDAGTAIPALLDAAAQVPSRQVREAVTRAIATLGDSAPEAVVKALSQAMRDDSWYVRDMAIHSCLILFKTAGDATPALVETAATHYTEDTIDILQDVLARVRATRQVMPELVRLLKHENPLVRRFAAAELSDLDADAKPGVPALVEALADPRPEVRGNVAVALSGIGPDARAALPALLGMLRGDPELRLRRRAAEAIASIGQAERSVVVDLTAALDSGDDRLSAAAASALGRLDPPPVAAVPALVRALGSAHTDVATAAARALGRIGAPARKAEPALRPLLRHADALLRFNAAVALMKIAPPDQEALDTIIEGELVTGGRLRELGDRARPGVPALVHALKGENVDRSVAAARALASMGAAADAAVPELVSALTSKSPEVRRTAAAALGAIGPKAEEGVEALAHALDDSDEDVKFSAAEALGKIGPKAKGAESALRALVGHKDRYLRHFAISALGSMGQAAPETAALLVRVLRDPESGVQEDAARALGRLGVSSEQAIDALAQALGDRRGDVRAAAAEALGRLGPAAQAAVPALLGALRDRRNSLVRAMAAEALAQVGARSAEAIDGLVSALRDPNGDVRVAAIQALIRLAPADGSVVSRLAEALEGDRDWLARVRAAEALGKLGRAPMPALEKALQDDVEDVRQAAAQALEQIRTRLNSDGDAEQRMFESSSGSHVFRPERSGPLC